jgi:hypothetical protein
MQMHYRPTKRICSCLVAVSLFAAMTSAFAKDDLSQEIGHLHESLQAPLRHGDDVAKKFVANWVDIRSFTHHTFGDYLEESLEAYEKVLSDAEFRDLVADYEAQLATALGKRLVHDLGQQLNRPSLHGLKLQALEMQDGRGTLHLSALHPGDATTTLEAHLLLRDERWQIDKLTIGSTDLSTYYRQQYRDIITNLYSLPVLIARLADRDYIIIDDFSTTPKGQKPRDWGAWRDKDQDKPLLYQVQGQNDRHYLAASDSGYSVILGKFVQWNPREYPIMTWCWRANALPPGGNEFLNHANDSAAGIYVIFSQNWLRVPKQVKYVWSSTLPKGTVGRRNKIFRPWFFVVESGEDNVGKWAFEIVDLERDHKLKLGGPPAKSTIGLGLLTDANSTDSYAEAFYADIRVWKRKAMEQNLIKNHCGDLPRGTMQTALRNDNLLSISREPSQ